MAYIAGTLELASKVRYGLSSRGVPLFRFVPYDKRFSPIAVGCSSRNLFYNVHAIVEPNKEDPKKGSLIQNLGVPSEESERQVLLMSYAYDSLKALRKELPIDLPLLQDPLKRIDLTNEFTFHIDPPGCKDVDDCITLEKLEKGYRVWIHIADVSAWVEEGSELDKNAFQRATSFYTLDGNCVSPMLPRILSEECASLLPSPQKKPALSLSFLWTPGEEPHTFQWYTTWIRTTKTYTYESALGAKELEPLKNLAVYLGADSEDSHTWIEQLMLLYNTMAGSLLKEKKVGILRRHPGKNIEKMNLYSSLIDKYPSLYPLLYDSAENCLASDENTEHVGLQKHSYAWVSSPLRRYTDLVNQRVLKSILYNTPFTPITQEAVDHLNRRHKQAKAFSRDLFFSTALQNTSESVKGIVINYNESKNRYTVFVPIWKRTIKVKKLDGMDLKEGNQISIQWYDDRQKPNWKERIVFRVE